MSKSSNVTVETTSQFRGLVKTFWDDRVGFCKHILGFTPSAQQGQVLEALDKHDHVVVKSGIAIGKTALEAASILHYSSCRYPFKSPCTSPSKDNLRNILWPELGQWHKKMHPVFRDRLVWTKEKLFVKEDENSFFVARTASKDTPESLQGFHQDYVFRIVDEASGVPEEIFDILEGATGNIETKSLTCGNPTRLEGSFFDAFNKQKEFYAGFTFSSLDSPFAQSRVIERIRKKFGETSNMWRIRVLGEFPLRNGDSFIPFDLADSARLREIPDQRQFPKVFGCDIARYGDDDTVIAIRQGDEFKPFHVLKNKSTMEVAGFIAFLANREKPQVIFIDVIGIGSGVYDRLEELGYPVIPVNVSETPALDTRQYRRLRDELWGQMRDWLETRRGKIWDNEDGDLVGQLTTPKYRILESSGLVVIESKDDMKKRGIGSPNVADACLMTFAQPVSSYQKEVESFYGERDEAAYQPMDVEAGY